MSLDPGIIGWSVLLCWKVFVCIPAMAFDVHFAKAAYTPVGISHGM